MSIDERRRHALYERLEGVLDPEHADTLMALLPPVGWAEVATKQDLAALEQRMELRFEAMDSRSEVTDARFGAGLSDLRAELHAALRTQTWSILGVILVALTISEIVSRVG
jgi:hypothetical protein